MALSSYIAVSEFPAFGLDASKVQPRDVVSASSLVDSYLNRPEGLVWVPDADGNPAYMLAASATRAFALAAPLAPGTAVVVTLPTNLQLLEVLGEVVVIDRDNPGMEACRIIGATDTTITLDKVLRAHAGGVTVEFGLAIMEERSLPDRRSVVRVSRSPMSRFLSIVGRYSYGRRSQQVRGDFADFNLLAAVQTFGGPPAWVVANPASGDVSLTTGEIWAPAGLFLAYYSEVRLWYLAGYPGSNDASKPCGVPAPVKHAVASAIAQQLAFPEFLSGNIKSVRAGDTAITRFRDSILDSDTKRKLDPYKATSFG